MNNELRHGLFSGDQLERVAWTPGELCPACLSDCVALDTGGSWCETCGSGKMTPVEVVQRRAQTLRKAGRRLPNDETLS